MNCEIQLAAPADAERISEMSGRLIEYGLPRSWDVSRVLRHIRRRDDVAIKAVAGTSLSGFAIMSFSDDAAHLNLLAVESCYRGMAIGRRLLTWLEQSAVGAGTFFVSLEVRARNQGARDFYRALGYEETDVIEGYYSDIEDAIVFARDLRVCQTT